MKNLCLIILFLFCSKHIVLAQQYVPGANNILYVKKNATGSGNGSSWNNAIPELADALKWAHVNKANFNNTPLQIWISSGSYKPKYSPQDGANFGTNQGRKNSFLLVKNVSIYGGFAGNETALTQRVLNSSTNVTILSGDIGILNDSLDNTNHVLIASGDLGNAVVDGFTIKDGNGTENGSLIVNANSIVNSQGGGIYVIKSNLIFSNNILIQNYAKYGAGMYANKPISETSDFLINILNCNFKNNNSNQGSGIYLNNYNASITNSTFENNAASFYGGGIYNVNSTPTITNSSFINNSGVYSGGAIQNDQNSSTILISSNFIGNSGQYGGAISNKQSSLNISNSIFNSNSGNYGGAISNYFSSMNISNTKLIENSANFGGGIHNRNTLLNIINSTFLLNSASFGGAIDNIETNNTTITNSNFSKNRANYGGAIRNDSYVTTFINNTIIWDNFNSNQTNINNILADNPNNLFCKNSLIQGSGGSNNWNATFGINNGNNLDTNPLFTNFALNDFSLQSNSPAINAGDNIIYGTTLLVDTDILGNPRLVNQIIDIGAYEKTCAINFTVAKTNVSCNSISSGAINLTVTNGLPPYTFIWNDGFTTEDRTNLTVGEYTVIIKDANNCTTSTSITIQAPDLIPQSPTGVSPQSFVQGSLISQIIINPSTAVFYISEQNALTGTNPLSPNLPLVNGTTYYAVVIGANGCRSTPLAITVNVYLSNDEFDLEKLKYYPNPVNDKLNIEYFENIVQIEVYDLLGKKVKTFQTDDKHVEIDLSELSSSNYILQLKTAAKKQFIKIIKK
ncbi:T9SS type A sorting domain-containing protein [Flavobacterium sp. I3-2]|uniref:T9SS type A sorting domain-containing protein n=1 Tax=Flavobacterium sp. I3-2 TaxID=2748319 RepID=UPI0015ADDDD3|nr:T9SS type A sorting domain-containing protein [Flavobacterium sp. I3-2]